MSQKKTEKQTKSQESNEQTPKFAVVDLKGTQLKVSEGQKYEVNFLEGEKGQEITIDTVLLYANDGEVVVGKPYIDNAKVKFEIDSQKKGDKVEGMVYKPKKGYRRKRGHRALETRLLVKEISI